MMKRSSRFVLAGAGCLACAGMTQAQWISFTDETGSRLQLSTVPVGDDQEKDFAVGDFDKDGWMDVVVVRKRPFSNQGPRQDVLLMNEQGVLVDRTTELASGFLSSFTDARDVVVVDVDNDGWDDLAIANTFGQQPTLYMNLGNDGKGNWQGFDNQSFRLEELDPPPGGAPLTFCAIWAGDANNDGWMDLYMSSYSPGGGTTTDRLLMNDGSGHFTDETETRLGNRANSAFGTSAEFRDFNNDGFFDIIKTTTLYGVSPWGEIGQFILYNDGSGDFRQISWQELSTSSPYMVTSGDLNGDGIPDVYSVQDGQDRTHLSTGMGGQYDVNYNSSNISQSPRTDGFGGNVKMIDIDGDGDLDVGVSPVDVDIANCDFGGEFALLRNNGSGQLTDPWSSDQNIHVRPHDFAYIDIDNDGCLDIFMGLCEGWRVFMRDNCPTTFLADLDSYNIVFGSLISGDLDSLRESDNDKLLARSIFGFSALEPDIMEISIMASSPATSAADLDLRIESSINTPNSVATIRLRNWNNNVLVTVDQYTIPLNDGVRDIENVSNPTRFVRGSDGAVELRIKHVAPAVFSALGFTSRLDETAIFITP